MRRPARDVERGTIGPGDRFERRLQQRLHGGVIDRAANRQRVQLLLDQNRPGWPSCAWATSDAT